MPNKENMELNEMDKRIISRKVLFGELSEKELKSSFKKLPDLADNAEEIVLEIDEEK